MAEESRRYLREQIELQKRQIAEQHDVIAQMYVEDLSTGLYNRNRYNQVCDSLSGKDCGSLGIAYFDLNGLKKINDLQGHQAGDALIRRTAECLLQAFGKKAYRIGGDEFIVIDRESGREAFHACVENALRAMEGSHISISCGISWRAERGNIDEQINEADKKMYLAKRDFYACKEHDRRHYWPEQE
ncbi:MAG: GGDEF domain-containing protein [Desulfovibrio piger]|uniref:GGDEF domain-containing protein n=1 Tax=Desulfovibrio piger TaxID=901 RepID=UPI0026F1903B|nr:GGDEF domain-containing protein [Desulfovibrio piger]MCI7373969.1 GGDEF domain-containing protein [Desulfovibrio piger]